MPRLELETEPSAVEPVADDSTRVAAGTAPPAGGSTGVAAPSGSSRRATSSESTDAAGAVAARPTEPVRPVHVFVFDAADVLQPPRSAETNVPPDEAALALAPSDWRPAVQRWTALFHNDSQARAVQHPRYVLAELQAAPWQPWPADHARAVLLATADWSSAAVLLPKLLPVPTLPLPGLRWTLRGVRLVGNRLLGGQSVAAYVELLQAALEHVRRCRLQFLLLEDVDERSVLWRSLAELDDGSVCVFVPDPFQARLRIRLPRSADQYWSRFPSRTRCGLRRKVRRAASRVQRVTEPDQVADFLRHAHRVSLHTWQTRQLGLRVKNDQRERLLLTALAELRALRSYLLWHDDQPVAFVVGTQFNGWYDYEEVGYDSRFAHLSPGQVLLVQMLDDLFEHDPPQWFDFGGGDAEYKRTFATDESRSGNVLLLPQGSTTTLATATWRCRQALGRAARRALAAAGLWRKVRHWSRRGRTRRPSRDGRDGGERDGSRSAGAAGRRSSVPHR